MAIGFDLDASPTALIESLGDGILGGSYAPTVDVESLFYAAQGAIENNIFVPLGVGNKPHHESSDDVLRWKLH